MIDLTPHSYPANACASFRRSRERHGDLSNMTFGFPITVNGLRFQGPEALYQALKYPHNPGAQQRIAAEPSGMAAKKTAYLFHDIHPDWEQLKITAMALTLALKLTAHPQRFGAALRATGQLPIVELSTRDAFWGAKPTGNHLHGVNALGQLLTTLRDTLNHPEDRTTNAAATFLQGHQTETLLVMGERVAHH